MKKTEPDPIYMGPGSGKGEERPSLASIRSSTSTSAVMSRASPWKSWSSCFSKPSTTLSIMPSMRSMAAEMFSPSTSWSSSWA